MARAARAEHPGHQAELLTGALGAGEPAGQPEDLEDLYGGLLPSTPEREQAAQVHWLETRGGGQAATRLTSRPAGTGAGARGGRGRNDPAGAAP